MSNETKRDVLVDAVDALADAQASGGNVGHQDANLFMVEYEKALPDDLPVIPEEVGEYLKRYKLMFTLFGFLRDAVSRIDTPLDDLNQTKYHWIANNQNAFARAWLLGVWRVEETGEIVKLEADK
jgi:hypothetical protein